MAMKGHGRHLKRLQGMSGRVAAEVRKLVYTLADMHVTEAAHSITAGAVSGKNHVPSSPGQAPNADTHKLDRSGHVRERGPLKADSVFDAPYAAALEFGSEQAAERPFMRPAAKKVRKASEVLAKAAVKSTARRSTTSTARKSTTVKSTAKRLVAVPASVAAAHYNLFTLEGKTLSVRGRQYDAAQARFIDRSAETLTISSQ